MARFFNGTSSYLDRWNVIVGYPFSVALRFKPRSIGPPATLWATSTEGWPDDYHSLGINAAGQLYYRARTTTQADAVTSASATPGTWHSAVIASASSTSRTVYLDNASATDTTDLAPAGFDVTSIGRLGSADYFAGSIAEVAVWETALSADDAAALAAGLSPLTIQPQALVSYVPLLGSFGQEVDLVAGINWTTVDVEVTDHPNVARPGRPGVNLHYVELNPPTPVSPPTEVDDGVFAADYARAVEAIRRKKPEIEDKPPEPTPEPEYRPRSKRRRRELAELKQGIRPKSTPEPIVFPDSVFRFTPYALPPLTEGDIAAREASQALARQLLEAIAAREAAKQAHLAQLSQALLAKKAERQALEQQMQQIAADIAADDAEFQLVTDLLLNA